MTAFTFSIEQLRQAPPEVRRWFAGEIAGALAAVEAPQSAAPRGEPHPAEALTLAACTTAEALQVFELISGDAIAMRLFFELEREGAAAGMADLHAVRLADLARHVGLPDEERLLAALGLIDRSFRRVRGDGAASLFGFDDAGHLYLHDATRHAIRRVWHELVAAGEAVERPTLGDSAPPREGFVPPRVGPSEDVLTHGRRPA